MLGGLSLKCDDMKTHVSFRLRYFVITLLHILAFFEFPSSLSWTSDIRQEGRVQLPCGLTEGIEFVCLVFLLGDVSVKVGGRLDFPFSYCSSNNSEKYHN